mgnify:CR=1 FL=1
MNHAVGIFADRRSAQAAWENCGALISKMKIWLCSRPSSLPIKSKP